MSSPSATTSTSNAPAHHGHGNQGMPGLVLGAIGKGHGYARGGILPDNLSTHVFDGGGWLRKTTAFSARKS